MGKGAEHSKEWLKAISDLENSAKKLMAKQLEGEVIKVEFSKEVKQGALKEGEADWLQVSLPRYKGKDDFILAHISHNFNDPPIQMGFDRWFFILEGEVLDPVEKTTYKEGDSVLVKAGEYFTTHGVKDSMLIIRIIK